MADTNASSSISRGNYIDAASLRHGDNKYNQYMAAVNPQDDKIKLAVMRDNDQTKGGNVFEIV
ncbi:MAG: hypothetical protein WC527_01345 [Candidatus Margulisiibacteriota bacterium]